MSAAAAFVWSPVRFFSARLESAPNWRWALAAPLVCGLLDMLAVYTMGSRNIAAAGSLLSGLNASTVSAARFASVLTLVGYPIYFALMALIAASVDVLLKDSGRQLRLVEFTGFAFFAFLPACLFSLVVSVFWIPPPLAASAGSSFLDIEAAAAEFAAAMKADAWLSTARIVYLFSLGWCAALVGTAMAVASGIRKAVAVAMAFVLFVAFAGIWY